MESSPRVVAEQVRMQRDAVETDLARVRVRIRPSGPSRQDAIRWAQRVVPIVAGTAAGWWWNKRRQSVDRLLFHALNELYETEQRLVPALWRMAGQASDRELTQAFEAHSLETAVHVDRLESVFRTVGARPKRSGHAAGLAWIVSASDRLLKRKVADVRDSSLIATAHRIERLEIAAYETARTYAEMLGFHRAARILQQTLDEERSADGKLTRLAEGFVNRQSIK